jgi:hypothetical protein
MQPYKGLSAVIVTAADENFASLLIDLCESLGPWRRYLTVVDLGLAAQTRSTLARMGVAATVVPDSFFANAKIEANYVRGLYLRPSMPDLFPADIIMHIDADCWIQRQEAIPTYFDSAIAHPGAFAICTTIDPEYPRCIENYGAYLDSYQKQYVILFGQAEADRLAGKAIFAAGAFCALRTSPVWQAWRETVSAVYDSSRASMSAELAHMAEQHSLNLVLHRHRAYHVLPSEMNWHCHCSNVQRQNGMVTILPSGRVPAIVHLADMKAPGTRERYRRERLHYEKPATWRNILRRTLQLGRPTS